MATTTLWKCDECGVRAEGNSMPAGWVEMKASRGAMFVTREVCAACSPEWARSLAELVTRVGSVLTIHHDRAAPARFPTLRPEGE